jgi:hypothetical protein
MAKSGAWAKPVAMTTRAKAIGALPRPESEFARLMLCEAVDLLLASEGEIGDDVVAVGRSGEASLETQVQAALIHQWANLTKADDMTAMAEPGPDATMASNLDDARDVAGLRSRLVGGRLGA